MLGTTKLFDENDRFVVEISMIDAHEMVESSRAKWKWRRRHGQSWKRIGVQMLPPPPPPSDSAETRCSLDERDMVVNAFAAASLDEGERLMGYERRTMARVNAWPETERGLECKAPTIVGGRVAGPASSEIGLALARDPSHRFSL